VKKFGQSDVARTQPKYREIILFSKIHTTSPPQLRGITIPIYGIGPHSKVS
jgi:hypothetical protein